jgi:hypothetical protein
VTGRVHLALIVEGCEDDPKVLVSRDVPDGERLSAYALAVLLLETAARLIGWQSYRDRTRDEFEAIVGDLDLPAPP